VKRGKYRLAAYAVFCATFYFSSMWVLRTYSSANATFWVFMLPMPLTSAALMCAALLSAAFAGAEFFSVLFCC